MDPYEPVTAYNAPQVILTQLLQGDATRGMLQRVVFNQHQLGLNERDSFSQKLAEGLGGSQLAKALTDTVTNPLMWLFFLTSPTAYPMLTAGKKVLWDIGAAASAYQRDHEPLLGMLNLLTAGQQFSGTSTPQSLNELSKLMNMRRDEIIKIIEGPAEAFSKLHNLHMGFDLRLYHPQSNQAKTLRSLYSSIWAIRNGAHEMTIATRVHHPDQLFMIKQKTDQAGAPMGQPDRTQVDVRNYAKYRRIQQRYIDRGQRPPFQLDPRFAKYGEAGPPTVREMVRDRLIRGNPFERLEEIQGTALADAFHRLMSSAEPESDLVRLFLRPLRAREVPDITVQGRGFMVDTDKVLRMYRGRANPMLQRGAGLEDPETARGLRLINELISPETSARIFNQEMSLGEFRDVVTGVVRHSLDPEKYYPRNIFDVVGKGGKYLTRGQIEKQGVIGKMMATGRITPRSAKDVVWAPEDLQMVADEFGATPELTKMIRRAKSRITGRLATRGEQVVYRIRPIESFMRYLKDANETHAMYVAPVSDTYLDFQDIMFPRSVAAATSSLRRHAPSDVLGESATVGETFRSVNPDRVPAGGWSYSDAIWAEANLMKNDHAVKNLTEVILPTVMGRMSSRHGVAHMLAHVHRLASQWLLQTPLPKLMEEHMGEWGKNAVQHMQLSQDPTAFDLLKARSGDSLARWLYVTHLGVNMSSVLMNMLQPLMMVGPTFGGKALMHGYKEAFRELGAYLKERKGLPLRLSEAQRHALIVKHFKFANVNGEDLLDISGVLWHNIDALAEGQVTFRAPTWTNYLMKEAPLKLFEKAEWLNRLVTAHAADFFQRARGVPDNIRNAMVQQSVREMQYGSHALNTPLAFMGKSLLSDATLRQFMQFPLRTFTGFLYGPKMLAGDHANALVTGAKQWLRAYGYGAVAYESMRGVLGADIARGTAPYAAFDIFNSDRFVGPGGESAWPINTPPVVNIASDFFRWAINPGDTDALRSWALRLAPGGVALGRMAGLTSPEVANWGPGRLLANLGGFQVGWDRPAPDGTVPVYKTDGTLVGYQPPLTMLMRGLGLDMRKFANETAIAKWLATNRDEMVGIKREALTAILNNNFPRFNELDSQMQKRFGFPIKFTKAQLRSQMQTRTITRPERLLDRMPPEVRGMYASALREHAPGMGLTPDQLEAGGTAGARTGAGAYRPQPLSPEAQSYLDAMMVQQPPPER